MPDYQKGKIYKIWSPSKNLVYYGSTIETISARLAKHIYSYKYYNEDNTKRYYSSYLVLECEDYKIELVEEYPCNNKQQLSKKEGEYIKANECVNMQIAGRTAEEYYKDNADRIKEYQKINADKINERQQKYYENNPAKLKEKYKKYRDTNRDEMNEKRRQYYLKQKELKDKLKDKL